MAQRKRSTVYTVADHAGVSTATVSRVLRGTANVSDATKERVLAAAAALHYVPSGAAAHLASSAATDLGLVIPATAGPYFSEVVVGFEAEAGRLGYAVGLALVGTTDGAAGGMWRLAERCEGLLFAARSSVDDATVAGLAEARAVVTMARGNLAGVGSVLADNFSTSYELTAHLLDTGRRHLLYVGQVDPESDRYDRYDGFVRAHHDRGLDPQPALACDLDEEGGRWVAGKILTSAGEVDGLVCANDLIAVALHRRLQLAGYVIGDDIAVVGWDDMHAARYLTPGLTTVSQPVAEMAATAARHLHALIEGRRAPRRQTVLPTVAIYRGSCCVEHAATETERTAVAPARRSRRS